MRANPDLFVDAGGWIALANSDDRYHAIAASSYPEFLRHYRRLLTTTLVVAESYVALRLALGQQAAVRFLDILEASPRIHRVAVDLPLEQTAERILRQYTDQRFSYTDAVSFAVMQRLGLIDAFAFDHHFATFGFVCVPLQ
jgi:predicted nucleic acid-binding protein